MTPSPLRTKLEAAIWLRILADPFDPDEKSVDAAVRAVGRLVEEKRLRPIVISGRHFFAEAELLAFVERETSRAPLAAAEAPPTPT